MIAIDYLLCSYLWWLLFILIVVGTMWSEMNPFVLSGFELGWIKWRTSKKYILEQDIDLSPELYFYFMFITDVTIIVSIRFLAYFLPFMSWNPPWSSYERQILHLWVFEINLSWLLSPCQYIWSIWGYLWSIKVTFSCDEVHKFINSW